MKLTLLSIIILFMCSSIYATQQTELISHSNIKKDNLTIGFSIVISTPKNSSGTVELIFRDWEYDYFKLNKSFEITKLLSSINFSLKRPYQYFLDSFILETIVIGNKSFTLNKKFLFNHINRRELAQEISFQNISYNQNGSLEFEVNFSTTKNYEIVLFKAENNSQLLFEKYFPLNPGINNIKTTTFENLSSFNIKADVQNKIPEFSEINNIAYYPFEKLEFCGDYIDNDNDNLVDETCPNKCPDVVPGMQEWIILNCGNESWEVERKTNISNFNFNLNGTTTITKKFKNDTNISIFSQVPYKVISKTRNKKACLDYTKNSIYEINKGEELKILVLSQPNKTISISSHSNLST